MGLFQRCMVNSTCCFTIGIYVLAYYYYITLLLSEDFILAIAISIVFNVFYAISLLSFLFTVFINPGNIPDNFTTDSLADEEKESLQENYVEIDFALGRVTFCKKCDKYRPARSHHCSTCEKCILRYDHHCPFIANCVGFRNQKAFILFLIYSGLALLILAIMSTLYTADHSELTWIAITCTAYFLGLYVLGFGITQTWMLCINATTLELSNTQNIFDTGDCTENACQVLGKNKCSWFLPFIPKTLFTGIYFPVKIRNKAGNFTVLYNKYLI